MKINIQIFKEDKDNVPVTFYTFILKALSRVKKKPQRPAFTESQFHRTDRRRGSKRVPGTRDVSCGERQRAGLGCPVTHCGKTPLVGDVLSRALEERSE